jgi:hypothetical protein
MEAFSFLRPLKPPSSLIVPKIVIELELELELGLKLLRLGEFDYGFRTRGICRKGFPRGRNLIRVLSVWNGGFFLSSPSQTSFLTNRS